MIGAGRRLAWSRTAPRPWPARLLGPIILAVAIALPWLPAGAQPALAATWLLGIGSGAVLVAAMTPGVIIVLAGNNGASSRAIITALCLTATVTLVYAERERLGQ